MVMKFSPTKDQDMKMEPMSYLRIHYLWSKPPVGFLKINIDSTFQDVVATRAMMVKDNLKTLLLLRTHIFNCNSSYEIETCTLEWPTNVADKGN